MRGHADSVLAKYGHNFIHTLYINVPSQPADARRDLTWPYGTSWPNGLLEHESWSPWSLVRRPCTAHGTAKPALLQPLEDARKVSLPAAAALML